jgi:hypothetical protein
MGFFDKKKEEDPFGKDPLDAPAQFPDEPTFPNLDAPEKPIDFNNPSINEFTNTPKPDPYQEPKFETQTPMNPVQNNTQPVQQTTQNNNVDNKDIQIIIAKLDAIKSELDSLQQRVQKIEKIAETEAKVADEQVKYGRW